MAPSTESGLGIEADEVDHQVDRTGRRSVVEIDRPVGGQLHDDQIRDRLAWSEVEVRGKRRAGRVWVDGDVTGSARVRGRHVEDDGRCAGGRHSEVVRDAERDGGLRPNGRRNAAGAVAGVEQADRREAGVEPAATAYAGVAVPAVQIDDEVRRSD